MNDIILKALLDGKIIKQTKNTKNGILEKLYKLENGQLYSKSNCINRKLEEEHWWKSNVLDLNGKIEIIE